MTSPAPVARWGAIEQLFTRGLELPLAEREEYLASACTKDLEMRSEVRSLLAAHDTVVCQDAAGDGFLGHLDAEGAAALVQPTEEILPALREALGDRYVVERRIGSGGMAEVFAAYDVRHDRMVALKLVRHDCDTPELQDRFEREVRTAARLQHPHVVPLYDSGVAGGHRYYVMPFVDGPTLRQRLQEIERFPIADVVRIVEDVAGALGYAHASGIVHRDIKPENILLSGGHAVVVDFGVARPVTEGSASTTLTRRGMAVGTPTYMSPEQAAGERVIDGRSDQYALACVAYELLAGRPPFTGDSAQAVIEQHFVAVVPPLALGCGPVSRALGVVISRALAKEPAARFASTVEFATALRRASTLTHEVDPPTIPVGARSAGNLPTAASPIIGRDDALDHVIALLREPDVRLVTLTGPGGTGKTRLALEIGQRLAQSCEGGVWFVSLAHVTDPNLVPASIGDVLGLRDHGAGSTLDAFAGNVDGRRMLLVLDNFEQVATAGSWLAALLSAAPTLRVLVTSRALLRVRGEHEYSVPPLEVPEIGSSSNAAADFAAYPSVELFTERGRAVEASFALTDVNAADVAEICVRLDGLPLAIELAAARVNLLSPRAILDRLEHRLRLLTRGARDLPERHQTLRHAMLWSYELLQDVERRLFTRLGVFAGGFTVEAAEAVCNTAGFLPTHVLDGIGVLLDASLLQRGGRGGVQDGPRIRMIGTIRELALELLAHDDEADGVRDRHRDWFLGLARCAAPMLTGPQQDAWLATLSSEHANLRAALERSVRAGDAAKALALGAALWRYWLARGHVREGCEWLHLALSLPAAEQLDTVRAEALMGAGTLAHHASDLEASTAYLSAALELRRRLADSAGEARALADLGWLAWRRCEYGEAKRLSYECFELSRDLADKRLMGSALNNLGWVAMFEGDYSIATAALEHGLGLQRELADTRGVAYMLMSLQWTATMSQNHARALSLAEEVLPMCRAIGDVRLYGNSLTALARASLALGDVLRARAALEAEVLPIMRQTGDRWNLGVALCLLSSVMLAQGYVVRAASLAEESLSVGRAIHDRHSVADSLSALASVARRRGDEVGAQALFTESLVLRREIGDRAGIAECERALDVLTF